MTVTDPAAFVTASTGSAPVPLRVVNRRCTLCGAHCGIRVEVADRKVVRTTGDPDDAHSRCFICPTGTVVVDPLEDPDRLRRPVKRVGETFVEIGWDEEFRLVGEGLRGIRSRRDRDAIATYLGNPGAHSSGAIEMFTLRMLYATSTPR